MIQIKDEFKKLIPALTVEEFNQLEQNCLNEGIREKIITWNGFIIDGHNRYEIATRWNLEYETETKRFKDENEVKLWMIDNQNGRRNLTDGWKYKLQQIKKEILLLKGKEKYEDTVGRPTKEKSLSIVDNDLPKHNTREIIAKTLNWSTGKVAMADIVFKKATPELEEKVLNNEITINQAYQDIKKEEKKEQQEVKKQAYKDKIETVSENEFKIDIFNTGKKFRIIYADPPWQYDLEQTSPNLGGAIKHYNSMSINELCNLPIKEITEKDAVLFLWVTSPKLNLFLQLMDAWGFDYKTSFVWDKVKHNMGHYNSVRHEFLLIGGKGKSTPDVKKLVDSVISIERSDKHSEKPIEFIELIDSLYTYGNRIELFARQAKKDNWFYYGNEI
jgi:N6-adenosine-specific RNA methylase IME4